MNRFLQTSPSIASSVASSPASLVSVALNEQPTDSPPDVQFAKNMDDEVKKCGREGYAKSKSRCCSCKRARIKGKENCSWFEYCTHRGLRCEWLEIQSNQAGTLIQKPTRKSLILTNPRSPSPVSTVQDFRLFNHFIQTAFPHYPVDNDSIWKHEIPSIASDYDFLLHAMLALSASDLVSATGNQELTVTAMSHRVKSIKALKNSISGGLNCFEQGNAMLATSFALLFQSTLMHDGLAECMAFTRGITAVGVQMEQKKLKPLFIKMFGDEQMDLIGPALQAAPLIDVGVVSGACRSLEKIGPLCQMQVEVRVYGIFLTVARNLVTSSWSAYLELRKFYELIMMMPNDDFRHLMNPANDVGRLLQAHFAAMQLIMSPITKAEWAGRTSATSGGADGKSGRWLEALHKNIPAHMLKYYEWTLWVEKEAYHGTLLNGVFNSDFCN